MASHNKSQRHPITVIHKNPEMTIGDRIKQARARRGMSRPELAEAAGIKYPTLAGIENSDQTETTKLPALAEALGVNIRWLQTGKGPIDAKAKDDEMWTDVVGYAQSVGAGDGQEAQEYAQTHTLKFKANSLRRKGLLNRRLAVYYAKGDSMEPRIHTGDAILFDQDDTVPVHDGIFIVRWRGEEYVKRAKVVEDLVLFESDNPGGDHIWGRPKRMDSVRDPIEIVGRVRWIGSWED